MANEKKQEFSVQPRKVITPKGEALFPRLQKGKPDVYEGAEHYKVNLIIPAADCAGFCESLKADAQKVLDEFTQGMPPNKASQIALSLPYDNEYDDQGKETGNIIFKFKMSASYKDKKTGEHKPMWPKCFDAKGNPLDEKIAIGGGSIIKVSAETYPFGSAGFKCAGISLRLQAVQVIKLEEYGGGGAKAESYGFQAEDGYEQQTAAQQAGFEDEPRMFEKDEIPF